MISLDRIHWITERAHLVYLGLLPALATFAVLVVYGHPFMFLVFLGGIVAVSVYLAVVVSYTCSPSSLAVALFILLDGPVCAALAQLSGGNPYAFAIDSFLVDGVAIWAAIYSPPPAPKTETRFPQCGQQSPLMFSITPSVLRLT